MMRNSSAKTDLATPELLKQRLMLRVKEYAQLVGMPPATAYAYVKAGKIAGVVKIGNSLRIPVAVVLKQLKAASETV